MNFLNVLCFPFSDVANAKNSYGGYVGFSQFMAGSNYVILLGESNARAGLSGVDMSLVSTVCGNQ
jgi:hypothetical protein